jgi:hypothetical protein
MGNLQMKNKLSTIRKGIIWISCFLLLILCCLVPWLYLTNFRDWDYRTCNPKAANRIGVKPNRGSINDWIYDILTPGISRTETKAILERLGPTEMVSSRSLSNGEIENTYQINICSHPLNNIVLFANYSIDGKLIAITIDID